MNQDDPKTNRIFPWQKRIEWRAWLPSRGNVIFPLIVGAALLFYVHIAGAVPGTAPAVASTSVIPYQGRLADSGGNPLNGTYAMTFKLYNLASGGSALWTETWSGGNSVTVSSGLFNVMLGSLTSLPQNSFITNSSLWLGVTVGTDGEMTPRVQLGSAPFAVRAQSVPAYTDYYPLYRPQTLDLESVDASLKGFVGGFSDGRYGYFVPHYDGAYFGKVVRVDLQDFTASGVAVLDLTAVDVDLKGFWGGFTDGRYGYFVPSPFGAPFGKVARVDLQNFTTGGVTVLDLTIADASLKGFAGGFTDGRYGYLVPDNNGAPFGKVARVDLQNFTASGVTVLDLTSTDAGLKGFYGGFSDGRYGYFVPYNNGVSFGKVARVDLQNFTTGGVTVLDLTTMDASLKGFSGGFSDGSFGYFVPYANSTYFGKVARVNLQNFTTSGISLLDLTTIDPGLKGFWGGFSDGRYGYFVPSNNGAAFGKVVRVDLQNFTNGGVAVLDLTAVDAGLTGFAGAFSDGRYAYLVPQYNGAYSGKVARIQLFFGGGSP